MIMMSGPPFVERQDIVEARRWWGQAAAAGDPAAKSWIGELEGRYLHRDF
eukprot:SAG31_NODE_4218_length_3453_cov_2.228682_3_plen_50_part_00